MRIEVKSAVWACTKTPYTSIGDAQRAMQGIQRHRSGSVARRKASGVTPYRCPFCLFYHLGHRDSIRGYRNS